MIFTDRLNLESQIRSNRIRFVDSKRFFPEWDIFTDCDSGNPETITACIGVNHSGGSEIESQEQCFNFSINCQGAQTIAIHPPNPILWDPEYNYAVLLIRDHNTDISPIPLKQEFPEELGPIESRMARLIRAMRFQISEILERWPEAYIFKRLRKGDICTACTDPVTKKKVKMNCEICLDTGIVGGYEYIPYRTHAFEFQSGRLARPEFVPNKDKIVKFFVEPLVEILLEDIIVIPMVNTSYLISSNSDTRGTWGFAIASQIEAYELPKDSVQHIKLMERIDTLYGRY